MSNLPLRDTEEEEKVQKPNFCICNVQPPVHDSVRSRAAPQEPFRYAVISVVEANCKVRLDDGVFVTPVDFLENDAKWGNLHFLEGHPLMVSLWKPTDLGYVHNLTTGHLAVNEGEVLKVVILILGRCPCSVTDAWHKKKTSMAVGTTFLTKPWISTHNKVGCEASYTAQKQRQFFPSKE